MIETKFNIVFNAVKNSINTVLLTEDKDFGELVYRKKLGHSGVVLLRLDGCSPEEKSEIVSNVFRQSLNEIKSAFVVIDNRSMRVRRTPFGSG